MVFERKPRSAGPATVVVTTARSEDPGQPEPKLKPVRAAPPGKDIPTMGWPALAYGLLRRLGRPDIVPAPTKKERRLIAERERRRLEAQEQQEAQARLDHSIDELRHLSDIKTAFTTSFINAKGGAATTTTMVHVASLVADLLRTTVVATDFNKASGTSGVRLGRDYDETITLRGLKNDLKADSVGSFMDFISRLRQTRYGVRVISSDSIVTTSQHLASTDAELLLEAIRANSEYHFIDTANDITSKVTLTVIEASDPLVFTANVAMQDSLRQVAISMETLREHGYGVRVDRSVVVISNIPDGKQVEDYRKYLNWVNISDEVTREIPFHGQLLGVPHDPIVARDTEVDLESLDPATYQAYLDVAIAIFEQAPGGRLASLEPIEGVK